jgi:hypothetical protein
MQWRQWCSKPKGRLSMALDIRSISHKRPKPFYQAAQCTGSRRVRTGKPETQKPRRPTHTIGRERHTAKIDARPVRLPSLARRVRTPYQDGSRNFFSPRHRDRRFPATVFLPLCRVAVRTGASTPPDTSPPSPPPGRSPGGRRKRNHERVCSPQNNLPLPLWIQFICPA